jgi:hypothetical protein
VARSLELDLWVSRSGAADVGRSVLGAAWILLALVVGIAVGVGVGVLTHGPRLGMLAGLAAVAGAGRLSRMLADRFRSEREKRRVRLDGDALVVEGLCTLARRDLRSCRYDAVNEVLVLSGLLGWPMLAIEASIGDALRIHDALAIPERGVRTFRAMSIPAAVPWIGFWIVGACSCIVGFACVMVLGGPWPVALVLVILALPCATTLVPCRLHVSDTEITRSWLGLRRAIALVEITRASVEHHFLELVLRKETVRWRLRFDGARGQGALADWYYETWKAKADANDRVLLELIERRSTHALARVFE